MKKQMPFQIDIPQPCSQSWDDMTPDGQGRHCDSCRKTVIDFTTWSDTELFNFFAQQHGPICGRYHESQLHRPIHIPYQPHSRLYRIAIAMGMTLLFAYTPEVRAQSRAPYATAAVGPLLMPESKPTNTDSVINEIRGVVTDNKKEPLVNASVLIKQNGIMKAAAVTDFDGNYSIKGLDSGYYDVTVSYLGYKTATTTRVPVSGLTKFNVLMESGSRTYLGGPIITGRPALLNKYRDSYIIKPKW